MRFKTRFTYFCATALSASLLLCAEVSATPSGNNSVDAGSALALNVFERPDGADRSTLGTMTLSLASGFERTRSLTIYQRDQKNDLKQTMIRFHSPQNIRDTALLVDTASDSVWLYLPALNRVRRISSDNQGGRFVQSQLYYEDLEARHPDNDTHRLLADDLYEDMPTKVLESVPIDKASSAYTKRVSWIHTDTLTPLRIDFYEGRGEPSKRLEVLRLENIEGFWTVMESRITDLDRGDSTRIVVESIRYDGGLTEDTFTTSTLASPSDDPKVF